MKNRFNTYDIMCMVTELQRLIGMRVNQVYDIDNKTYVIRLQRSEEKSVLLLESGNRFHTTQFEWPKNVAPSGFTMKLRKHLKNKRLEKLSQLGIDRIVDLQFGSGEAAYHVILELYDRGNIVLTDYEWTILNVLRPHVEGDKVRFAVKEKYPLDRAKTSYAAPSVDALQEILTNGKPGDNLKKVLNPKLEFGAAIIDHVLLENGLSGTMKIGKEPGKGFSMEQDLEKLVKALKQAEELLDVARTQVAKGYITQKKETRPNPDGEGTSFLLIGQEFHPMLFAQHREMPHAEHETFDRAVDEFFSTLEGQKIDMKTVQVEREALKKLQNVRNDHEKRVSELCRVQDEDQKAAELISRNQPLVEQARLAVQAAIANQMSWDDIQLLVKTAQDNEDPIASCIKQLKLNTNHITLLLTDPYEEEDLKPMLVDIDLSLTAYANARRYYDQKRNAAKKQQKTIESAGKALKSAERKTKQTLKEAHTVSNIIKARKTYWFEKFFWFISSDNYLVIGGRDQQQNELLVKRYMRARDLYVHAEVTGAASVVVKNPTAGDVPPRTLAEAGQAAVAYSVAWEAKVLTRAWWVYASQVSKSAPTGEYLTTGSFMIRGRKNYLLPDHLQFGFSFMFRLEDSCIERHRDERKPIALDDASVVTSTQELEEDQEILVSDDDEQSDKEDEKQDSSKLDAIREEPQPPAEGAEDKEVQETEQREIEKEKESEKKEEDSDDDSDSSEEDALDTHIKVDHGTGQVFVRSTSRTISEMSDRSEDKMPSFPSLPKKGGKKQPQKQQQKTKEDKQEKKEGMKRGQRSKLKKIKEKYKDQDDEDRAIMMELLQSAKGEKESKKAQKKAAAAKANKVKVPKGSKIPQPAPLLLEADSDPEDLENEPDLEQTGPDADSELLNQLTGVPHEDDELLFAVPVVAPYSALVNYKYKVKLTPGTGKRGKAAKTAVQVFLRDKAGTAREKDLLKAVKEENIARNFPGKVKLSAPQLHKHKK
ncbi:ribosome quality control complex subunit NEMF homolog [Spodoptera frugiperda]|uniref:Ribosome quality control complex subunit NEMF homolog n=1 Tax=Spodoptera frugiperda TaxID=7108 RepID=A0A9R0DDC7_SPOFR|nr:ribosome quality control complex subunit NEMF homolog [Spodoptera frugiperda]